MFATYGNVYFKIFNKTIIPRFLKQNLLFQQIPAIRTKLTYFVYRAKRLGISWHRGETITILINVIFHVITGGIGG